MASDPNADIGILSQRHDVLSNVMKAGFKRCCVNKTVVSRGAIVVTIIGVCGPLVAARHPGPSFRSLDSGRERQSAKPRWPKLSLWAISATRAGLLERALKADNAADVGFVGGVGPVVRVL